MIKNIVLNTFFGRESRQTMVICKDDNDLQATSRKTIEMCSFLNIHAKYSPSTKTIFLGNSKIFLKVNSFERLVGIDFDNIFLTEDVDITPLILSVIK